jgi:hypothetical protein
VDDDVMRSYDRIMKAEGIDRRNLDSAEFLKLRQATEKISNALNKRVKGHLEILRPLFMPRKLLGTYVKSSGTDEVSGSDKAFATLQEKYAAVCESPFGLPKKLQAPLPPISNHLDAVPFQYQLDCEGAGGKAIMVTSTTKWLISFRSECPLNRVRAMLAGNESRNVEAIRQSLIDHISLVVFMEQFAVLKQLLEDLRYRVEIKELSDLGGLPVVLLEAPLDTFLPPDEFIVQITQLSGVPAFQEIIVLEAIDNFRDPLKEALVKLSG